MLSCDDFALSKLIIVILLKNWSHKTYASHGSLSTSSRDFYTTENMLDICSIHSGSLFEIAKCYCDSVNWNRTLSSQNLNKRLQPNAKRLLVSMIRTETILPVSRIFMFLTILLSVSFIHQQLSPGKCDGNLPVATCSYNSSLTNENRGL